MSDPVNLLLRAIDGKDPQGIRSAYAPDARLVTMTPNTFNTDTGVEAIGARLEGWFTSWGDDPSFSFLRRADRDGRVWVEFERTVTYGGAGWVVRQAHVVDVGPAGIAEHRIYCCGPREGEPELAAAYEGAS